MGLTKKKILSMLLENAERCLRGAPILGKDGKPEKDEHGNPKYNGIPSNPSAGNQALKLIGMETFNMFVEKHEIGEAGAFARLSDDELAQRIAIDVEALGLDPGSAEALLATFSGDGVKH